jgi:hypothetical protein
MGTECYVNRGADPADALCELPHKNFCHGVRLHWLPQR